MTDDFDKTDLQTEDEAEDKKTSDPMKFCFLCRRSEEQAGKMIELPNNIHICSDCMQKSFDSMNQQMSTGKFNISDLMNMPGVSMIDLSNMRSAPAPKKEKKKKEKT